MFADALTLAQKIYIAYYGRPADPAGLNYWANRLGLEGDEGSEDLEAVIEAFASSPESVALYGGLETTELVTRIYQQLFNREPDAAGLAFYTDRITSGEFTAATAMLDILNGARDTDLQVVDNKLAVAQDFTNRVTDQDLAYSGEAAAGIARFLLDQVSASPVQELETVTQLAVKVADLASTQTELVAGLIPAGGEVGDLLDNLPAEADAEDLLTLIEAVVTSALDNPEELSSLIAAGGGSFASTLEALDAASNLAEILNEANAGGAAALEALLNDSGTGGGGLLALPPIDTGTTAPTIASVSVASGSYKIGDTVAVTVTETNAETGLTLSGEFNGQTLTSITDNGDGTYTGTYTVMASDPDIADSSTVNTALVLTDTAGNASPAHRAVTLSGESIDATAPLLSGSSPVDGATAVAVGSNIVLGFDSTIALGSGSIRLVNAANPSDSRAIDVTAHNSQLSLSGALLTINPRNALASDSAYHLEIDTGAITDVAGNAYAGISNATTLNFATAPDTPPPPPRYNTPPRCHRAHHRQRERSQRQLHDWRYRRGNRHRSPCQREQSGDRPDPLGRV